MKYFVEICSFDDDKVVKIIECNNEKSAETVDRGVNRNLNHDAYYTLIVPAQPTSPNDKGE